MNVHQEVLRAETRIRSHINETPLVRARWLEDAACAEVRLKMENEQKTGSFKARGAMNRVLALTPEERARGLVAASTGNHGAAVAWAAREAGGRGLVFVPEGADRSKVDAIERLGGAVHVHGADCAETESYARACAGREGMTYISPYNDRYVVGGQGTVGIEIDRQTGPVDAVLLSLGGGGLISGVAAALKAARPEVRVIGCSPANSPVMIESVRAGRILDLPSLPTLSDGTAGGLEPGAITFDFCRELVDDYETVTEEEIVSALRLFHENEGFAVEGAAAVAVASYRKRRDSLAGMRVVIVICGGNMDTEVLSEILKPN